MTSAHRRRALAASLVLGLAGCAGPSGPPDAPVFGEWQGQPPGLDADTPVAFDLVLYGGPGAASGQYHTRATTQNPNQFSANGTQEWGGDWTSTQGVANGETLKFIILHDHLPNQIGGYALAPDGRLHALDPDGSLNTTPDGALYTLSPVRPRFVH